MHVCIETRAHTQSPSPQDGSKLTMQSSNQSNSFLPAGEPVTDTLCEVPAGHRELVLHYHSGLTGCNTSGKDTLRRTETPALAFIVIK